MKKWIALLLAVLMCLSLCACGGGQTNDDSSDSETAAKENDGAAEPDGDSMKFNEALVWEDEDIKVTLVEFYSKEFNWGGGDKQIEKVVVFKAENHSDHQLNLMACDFYLEDEYAYVNSLDGFKLLAPGKSGTFSFLVAREVSGDHEALDTLDELFLVNGTIEADQVVENENQSYNTVSTTKINFDLQDYAS